MKNKTTMNKHYPVRIDEQLYEEMKRLQDKNGISWAQSIRDHIRKEIAKANSKR